MTKTSTPDFSRKTEVFWIFFFRWIERLKARRMVYEVLKNYPFLGKFFCRTGLFKFWLFIVFGFSAKFCQKICGRINFISESCRARKKTLFKKTNLKKKLVLDTLLIDTRTAKKTEKKKKKPANDQNFYPRFLSKNWSFLEKIFFPLDRASQGASNGITFFQKRPLFKGLFWRRRLVWAGVVFWGFFQKNCQKICGRINFILACCTSLKKPSLKKNVQKPGFTHLGLTLGLTLGGILHFAVRR